jgi:hypothetical protein
MKSTRVKIEYVHNQHPFLAGQEYVVIFNGSNQRLNLDGWKLVYEDMSNGAVLHAHHFDALRGTFDPGERLCIISNRGTAGFQREGKERGFPGPHWDIYAAPMPIMNLPRVRLCLIRQSSKCVGYDDRRTLAC